MTTQMFFAQFWGWLYETRVTSTRIALVVVSGLAAWMLAASYA